MSWSTPRTWVAGEVHTAAQHNLERDQLNILKISLDDNGKPKLTFQSKSANYTLTTTDDGVIVTSGTNTQTLPTAVGCAGKTYIVKNAGTGAVTVATTSAQTIDGVTTYSLVTQFQSLTVVSDGANWQIV